MPWEVFDDFLAKAESSATPQGRFIKAICMPFIRDRHKWEGALICDAVAMAVALQPSVVKVGGAAEIGEGLGRRAKWWGGWMPSDCGALTRGVFICLCAGRRLGLLSSRRRSTDLSTLSCKGATAGELGSLRGLVLIWC